MIRAVGESRVPIATDAAQTVVFIVQGKRTDKGDVIKTVIGTGFVVEIAAEEDPTLPMFYVVTAAHVVRGRRDSEIRIPLLGSKEKRPDDREVGRWFYHPSADVAVTPILPDKPRRWRAIKLEIPSPPRILEYGDRIYFIGAQDAAKEMSDRVIPMVRSGTLGTLNQEGIGVRWDGEPASTVRGHLIDSRFDGGL